MARLAPRLPVQGQVGAQIGDLGGAQPDEDGQAHLADRRKGLLGVSGHPDGRMRRLERAGRDRRVLKPVELAVVAERLAFPGLPDDLERLAEPRLTLPVCDAVAIVRARDAAAADPELEPALADVIQRRDLLGDAQRVVEREHGDGRSHPEAPGPGRDRAGDLEGRRDHRAVRREVDLAEPDAVEAPVLGALSQLEGVPERRDLVRSVAHLLDEDPEMHGYWPPRTRAARPRGARHTRPAPSVPSRA